MNADVNLFGPGNRPNATIGRATRLILRNVFQMLPGISDKSTQGNPGQVQLLHRRARARQSVAAAVRGAGLSQGRVERHGLSPAAASATSRTTAATRPSRSWARSPTPWPTTAASRSGQSVVILAPEHMRIVAGAGWTREQAQDFLFSHAKRSVEGMKGVGKYRDREYDTQHGDGAPCAGRGGLRPSRPRARRYPDHDGRRRRRRPFVLHPVVEPRPRLDHAARPDRIHARGVRSDAALFAHVDHAQAQGVPRAGARQHRRPRIGILENGKLNAEEMLNEVAAALRAAQRLHRPHARLEEQRQRAGAGQHPGQGRAGGRFPDHRPGGLRLLLDVQSARRNHLRTTRQARGGAVHRRLSR